MSWGDGIASPHSAAPLLRRRSLRLSRSTLTVPCAWGVVMSGSTGSDILCFTTSYGDRRYLADLVPAMRGTAGVWFDWFIATGNPSRELSAICDNLMSDPRSMGTQYWLSWKENRGQHAATHEAIALAKKHNYKWLLRLDDDMRPKTKEWLKKMIARLEALKERTGDRYYRAIAAPKIVGLQNQLTPAGTLTGHPFPVDVMHMLGGACRLHPMELIEEYSPSLYDPLGRGDPQALAAYMDKVGGLQLRFPDIKMLHPTRDLEADDSAEQAHARKMSKFWPALYAGV